ncbi:MAG: minor capsid protein [Oscillospiraceae bacterium]
MSKKSELFRLPNGTIARLEINSVDTILKDKGLANNGSVQAFHTNNVLRRIQRYMPLRSGMTIKITIAQTDINKPQIVTNTPYAQYLYFGISKNGKPINYTKTNNPKAGAYWDRNLKANEGAALSADLQAFIKRRE